MTAAASLKLAEALRVLQHPPDGGADPLRIYFACGFTPLHMSTFLAAHLQILSVRRVDVQAGLYGDCLGNLERAAQAGPHAIAVALEWPDFDPRLGLRQLGGWDPRRLDDVLATVRTSADRLRQGVERAAAAAPVALSLPTLPLPPVSYTSGWQSGAFESRLLETVAQLGCALAASPRVRLVSRQRLDALSPPGERFDVRAELSSGFPYRTTHAARLGHALARLLQPPPAKKGLIVDLDDVLWSGILGEVGVDGISWDLDGRSQIHGVCQQLVRALAEAGVLVAVASKNDPARVEEALRREDLLVTRKHLFPIEVHWGPKSESVGRILRAWNVGADSVVFVDDSPMELAEVAAAHPAVTCLRFPADDEEAAYQLLGELRDLFGKERLSAEDSLRLDSLRSAAQWTADAAARGEGSVEAASEFLADLEAVMTVAFAGEPLDPRALELVNKTNQFNLNGRRYTEADWEACIRAPGTFLAIVAYRDKYGPLGKIAVLAGRADGATLQVDTWVMSCRAFARRIEHRCVEILFDRFGADEMVFAFEATERNDPVRDFFAGLAAGTSGSGVRLTRAAFDAACPPLFQRVEIRSLEHQ